MKNIVVVVPVTEQDKKNYREAYPQGNFTFCKPRELSADIIKKAHVIMGNPPPILLEDCENLKWLQLNSAGYDNYINSPHLKNTTRLTNARGAYGVAVAEHMLAMLFALQKKLFLYRDNQNQHLWKNENKVTGFSNQKVLVVGLGDIGTHFSKMMSAFDCEVIGIKRDISHKPPYVSKVVPLGDLDLYLPEADVVALAIPETTETKKLFTAERFKKMKKTAILINGGRGGLVDTDALYHALKNETIYAAGIDVVDPEPLPPSHPLWDLKNMIITPHISGFFNMDCTLEKIIAIQIDNLKRYANGEPLNNLVKR